MESYITGDAESVFKHFMKERYELKYDRGNYVKPSARTLLWHSELFLAIFDNVLTEFPAQLWRKGLWEAGIERSILGQILPFMPLHLAMDASRIPDQTGRYMKVNNINWQNLRGSLMKTQHGGDG